MAGVAERTLALKLVGDVSGLRKDLKPAQRQIGQFTKGLASWGKALAGGLVIGGVERLAGALGDAWDGYRSGEKAAAQLRKTWKNLGLQGKAYRSVLDKVTASTLALGTSDDEAVEAFSRSLNRTRDYKQSLRELAIAQDLVASGAATNLESAFRIIQQAGTGSARVVDRFGLTSKTAAGRIRELGDQVKGTAKAKAKLDPLGVLFNRLAEDSEAIVGAFAKGDFKGVVQGLQGLGETVADALFGPKGKDNIRNSKTAGLVNQFGGWASELAKSIGKAIKDTDWDQVFTDVLKGIQTFIESGAAGTLATIAGALAMGLFAVDAAVTALTALFSVPKLLVKGVISAIKTVGVAIAATMFGSQKVAEAAGNALAATITTAADGKVVAGAAARAGLGIGGLVAAGIGSLIAGAIVGGLTLATQEANRLPIALLASAKQARARGARDKGTVAAQLRRSFPQATDAQIEDALKGAGFARGTSSAPRGWHWVGERGPELMRFRGGEQVIPSRQSMAMAGGSAPVINITVNGYVGSEEQLGRVINRHLAAFVQRGGRLGYR